MPPLRPICAVLLGLCVLAGLVSLAAAQPRPQVVVLHTAEAGALVNGTAVPVLGYEAIAVQNTIAAAWDGTLTYEITTDGATWTAVNCRNALGTTVASTTVAAANYVVCPVTGAQRFRARVSGRTVGTVTATGGLLGMSAAGLASLVPPSGTSATQVQGTAADGATAVGNPVQVGGKDGAGNAQTFSTDTNGRPNVNVVDALPAGNNNIGDVDVVSVVPGTSATSLGKAEDAGHVSGDTGVFVLAVRSDDLSSVFVNNDLDYSPIAVDSRGRLAIRGGQTTNTGFTSVSDVLLAMGAVRNDVRGTLGTGNGAWAPIQLNSSGDLRVDGSGVTQPVSGTVTANQGTANATPWNTNMAQINGVTPLMGSGVTGTGSPRVSIASDANTVDTELPAAGTPADGQALPSAPKVVMVPLLYNGTNTDLQRSGSATSTDPHFGAAAVHRVGGAITYLASTTHIATQSLVAKTGLGGFNYLVVTWDVTAADRADANETYDLYITCGDGVSSWDIAHFPQIATSGAKRYTARIAGTLLPQNVTTATPGVAANDEATFKTDTAGADQGIRTLAAGRVRHGPCGDRVAAELVVAGTTPSITHSITLTVKP